MDFETAKAHLDTLDIHYFCESESRPKDPPRYSVALPLFRYVSLGWSADDWYRAASSDGEEYIGGCCGNLSAGQDIVSDWFRHHSDVIEVYKLADLINEILIPHGGFEAFEDNQWPDEDVSNIEDMVAWAKANWSKMYAYNKMAVVWKLVKNHYTPEPFLET